MKAHILGGDIMVVVHSYTVDIIVNVHNGADTARLFSFAHTAVISAHVFLLTLLG